jgi:nucleotide-binding universal stress UspA family protein
LAHIAKIAHPGDEVLLFSAVEPTDGHVRMRGPLRPLVAMATTPAAEPIVVENVNPKPIETKSQAVEAELAERIDYLNELAERLAVDARIKCEAVIHEDPACAIIEKALAYQPDMIVMATHGATGLVHILFGDIAEEVVRSGVAPVLLVHPENVKAARNALHR